MSEAGGRKIRTAKVDWVADAPRSILFGDIYFSGEGLAETQHVFLDGNDLERRFADARRFGIGELGFGSGLNFLAAATLWRRRRRPGARLDYLAIEKHPLTRSDLERVQSAWPALNPLSEALRRDYPPPVAGFHRLCFGADLVLTLVFGEAQAALHACEASVDAWFLDGFAPAKNPDMWTDAIFREIAGLSAPGATAATYTVAGEVRRGLERAGFDVAKRIGYGRKREMLTARLARPADNPSRRAPWFCAPRARARESARVAVIGGGIAGASLAFALTNAGCEPIIIDPKGLAAGASGNPAGLIMPRLDLGPGPASEFFLSAYVHARRLIERLQGESGEKVFTPCGARLLATSDGERARQKKILKAGLLPDGWIEGGAEGLFFPHAGVVDPAVFCRRLAKGAPLILKRALRLDDQGEGVAVVFEDGRETFDVAILANGLDAGRFLEARTLPLKGVMGQIDLFPHAAAPECAVAFGPYAAPAPKGGLVIGATYEPMEFGAAPRTSARATTDNIGAIAAMLQAFGGLDPRDARPRASARCQSPDRLPIVGPVPDWDFYGAAYDGLRRSERRDYPTAEYLPHRFLLTGLGSRGLVTAPLCSELLVSELSGAPAPFAGAVAEALHPARFFIRELKRARPKSSKSGAQ